MAMLAKREQVVLQLGRHSPAPDEGGMTTEQSGAKRGFYLLGQGHRADNFVDFPFAAPAGKHFAQQLLLPR